MLNAIRNLTLLLIAVAFAVVLSRGIHPSALLSLGSGVLFVFGAVTVTYLKPATGTVPPSANVVSRSSLNMFVAQVGFSADADTTATITHNMGFTTALTEGLPRITAYPISSGTFPVLLAFTNGSNTIVVTKPSTAAGSAGTWNVIFDRPHSISR